MPRLRTVALLSTLALVAVACGGRVSPQQVQAERAADLADLPLGGALGAGAIDTSSSLDGGGFDGGASAGAVTDSGLGRSGAAGADAGSGGSTGGGGGDTPPPPPPPAEGNGGATDVGVTETDITVGNVSTLSGPVPGLFRGALVGVQAYAAKVNAAGGIYGRQIKVLSGDDNFDTGTNRAKHREFADKAFALVGSFSTFDSAGAGEMKASGIPDIGRALALARQNTGVHMSPLPIQVGWKTTTPEYFASTLGPDVVANTGFLWAAVDVARENAEWFMNAAETVGWDFRYTREVQATESDFTADIVQMRNLGIQNMMYLGDVTGQARLWSAAHQQNWNPPLKYSIATAYDSSFLTLLGDPAAAQNTMISQNLAMYMGEDASTIPEIAEFVSWMGRIDPNQTVDLFAIYGWLSAKLFARGVVDAGPNLTREGLLVALRAIGTYDSDGVTEKLNLGQQTYADNCELIITVKAGQFTRFHPQQGFNCQGSFVPAA